MELTPIESRVLDSFDEQTLVDTLVALIRVPSVTGTDAESELQHAQATLLEQSGLDVDAWKFDLDELRADPGFPGEETGRTEGYGWSEPRATARPRSSCRVTSTWCPPAIASSGTMATRSAGRSGAGCFTGGARAT
ncbi:hypothetical protein [Lacisediminihabitans profunda]|uniref:hypothetical protein n=1 Tax=Lacisediminihabitans profunda TaxID=2594790 RepID=UPI001C9C4AEF|nr:hypothetical protein [Lacisediminihabitans profunda]